MGSCKWHIARKLDMGADIPADCLGSNRFLDWFESFAPGLNLSHRGDHIRCEVDGDVSGDFDHEPRPFIEESREALDWRGHGIRKSGCRGGN